MKGDQLVTKKNVRRGNCVPTSGNEKTKKDRKLDSKAAITNTIQVAIYVSWKQVPKGGKSTESSYRTCREGSHCLVPVTELNNKIQSET